MNDHDEIKKRILAEMTEWIDLARHRKEMWVENDSAGDMPPNIVALRGDKFLAEVSVMRVDRDLGLKAAEIMRVGLDADTLVFIVDAHTARTAPGEDPTRVWPRGSMQKAYKEEETRSAGLVTACLVIHKATRDGRLDIVVISYKHRPGKPFSWLDEQTVMSTELGKDRMSGYVPDVLTRIMAAPPMLEDDRMRAAAQRCNVTDDPDGQLYHMSRATLRHLAERGFLVAANAEFGTCDG